MHRYREPLTSLLASAMLTSALIPVSNGLSLASVVDPAAARRALSLVIAQAPAGTTVVAADSVQGAVVPVSLAAPSTPIRPEKLQAIIDYTLAGDKVQQVSQTMVNGLGLPSPFMAKSAKIENGETRHTFAIGISPADRLIFLRRTPEMMRLYATDRSAKLLSAGTLVNGVFTAVPLAEARASFEEELRAWDAQVLPGTPATTVAAAPGNS